MIHSHTSAHTSLPTTQVTIIWDLDASQPLYKLDSSVASAGLLAVAWADASVLATGSTDNRVLVWSTPIQAAPTTARAAPPRASTVALAGASVGASVGASGADLLAVREGLMELKSEVKSELQSMKTMLMDLGGKLDKIALQLVYK